MVRKSREDVCSKAGGGSASPQHSITQALGFEISSEEILVLTLCAHHVVGTLSVLPGTAEALLPRLGEVTQTHFAIGTAFRSQIQLQLPARWNIGGKNEEPQGIESPEGVYRCLQVFTGV